MIDPKTKLVGATCKVVQHKFVFFEPRSESELIVRKTFHTCQNKKLNEKKTVCLLQVKVLQRR